MATSNLIGQVLDGKYRINEQLGKGGMGAVYSAIHLGTERPVALKVIAPQLMQHDEFVERFRREARAAGRLQHPNVVDVTDFGFAQVGPDQVAYLVMEYLDGYTLSDILNEESSLPLNWVIDILEQTCSAVEEAHRQGIIHRDLKPDNIWLEPNRRGGYTIKVLDFGIAKLDEPDVQVNSAVSAQAAASAEPSGAPFETEAPTLVTEEPVPIEGNKPLEAPTRIPALSLAARDNRQIPNLADHAIEPQPDDDRDADTSEAGTRILASPDNSSVEEADTRLLAADSVDEGGTRLLENRTTNHP